jgi:ubiquinone/menaquinone biosynthesis C-methylase UbiE
VTAEDSYAKISYRKGIAQAIIDLFTFPLRVLISDEANERLRLSSLRHERCAFTARFCEGRVLDVGCGTNKLAAIRRDVVGVDVHPWAEIDVLAETTALPFADGTFETVTLIACLNHITDRAGVLAECRRVLKPGGRILVTMIIPLIGHLSHRLNWWDPDQRDRGMDAGELHGMWSSHVMRLLREAKFGDVRRRRFLYGLNNLFLGRK